jgi:DNA-binding MarR family transcriptional regulator
MLSKPQLAAREFLEIIPLAMHSLGSEMRQSTQLPVPGHYNLLFMLSHGPHNLSELAEKHNVTPPTMSNTISTLVERGWVQRTQSSTDRRRVIIELTPSGHALLESIQNYVEASITRTLAPLSTEELDQLIAGLAVLRAAFRQKQNA